MRALIIEDKEYIRKGLLNLLQLIDANIDVLGECESVKDAVIVANACKPELVFLDINLLDGTAFDFIEQTENLSFKIIFITAYEEFALKALKIGAVDYLLKPVDKKELIHAVYKAKKQIEKSTASNKIQEIKFFFEQLALNKIALEIPKGILFVSHEDILFFEADGMYTNVFIKGKEPQLICKPIKHFAMQLEGKSVFYKPHRSYLVNLKHLKELSKNNGFYLIMENNKRIPLSIEKKEEFLQLVSDIF